MALYPKGGGSEAPGPKEAAAIYRPDQMGQSSRHPAGSPQLFVLHEVLDEVAGGGGGFGFSRAWA
jgi:hypothetical protein